MPDYLFFFLDDGEKVLGTRQVGLSDNAEAKRQAAEFAQTVDVEVWCNDLRICTVKKRAETPVGRSGVK